MAPDLLWLITAVSVSLCLFLWFREVRRVLRERRSMVDSAAGQLRSSREKAMRMPQDPETAAVLRRSERIYAQAVELYNHTLRRPLYMLPARLMGFRPMGEEALF